MSYEVSRTFKNIFILFSDEADAPPPAYSDEMAAPADGADPRKNQESRP